MTPSPTRPLSPATSPRTVARGPVRPGHLVAGVVLLAVAVTAAARWDTGVSSVLVFAMLPDIALLAGIGGRHRPGQLPRRAVGPYNLLHGPVVPALLLGAALAGLGTYWLVAAITWAAHIALDRGVGYGMRTKDGWQRG